MADNGDAGHRSFSGGKKKAKHGSTEFARKRIRNIERLFQRNADLPANVRNDLERELAAHKAIISDKSFQKRRSAMISKYHMVRFFGKFFLHMVAGISSKEKLLMAALQNAKRRRDSSNS